MTLKLALAATLITPALTATPAYAAVAPDAGSAAPSTGPGAGGSTAGAEQPTGFASVPGPDGLATTGAGVNAARPQLDRREASRYTVDAYLRSRS